MASCSRKVEGVTSKSSWEGPGWGLQSPFLPAGWESKRPHCQLERLWTGSGLLSTPTDDPFEVTMVTLLSPVGPHRLSHSTQKLLLRSPGQPCLPKQNSTG